MPGQLWHVVLFSFKLDATREQRNRALATLKGLGPACGGKDAGVLAWQVGENLDNRKGVDMVQISVFRNDEAFKTFRAHPAHQEAVGFIKTVTDWKVGDLYNE